MATEILFKFPTNTIFYNAFEAFTRFLDPLPTTGWLFREQPIDRDIRFVLESNEAYYWYDEVRSWLLICSPLWEEVTEFDANDAIWTSIIFNGEWDAADNFAHKAVDGTKTDVLQSGAIVVSDTTYQADAGHFYIVTTEGNTELDEQTEWFIGDIVMSDGVKWIRIPNLKAISGSLGGGAGAGGLLLGIPRLNCSDRLYFDHNDPERGAGNRDTYITYTCDGKQLRFYVDGLIYMTMGEED